MSRPPPSTWARKHGLRGLPYLVLLTAATASPFSPERFQTAGVSGWTARGVAEAAATEVAARLLDSESIQIRVNHRGDQHGWKKGNTKRVGTGFKKSSANRRAADSRKGKARGKHASAKSGRRRATLPNMTLRRPLLVKSTGVFVEAPSKHLNASSVDHMQGGSAVVEKSGHRIKQSTQDQSKRWDVKGTTDGSHGNDLVLFSDLADPSGDDSKDGEPEGDDDDDDDDVDPEEDEDLITPPVVNVTAEEDATVPANAPPMKAVNPNGTVIKAVPPEPDMWKLADGIGSMAYVRSPAGSRQMNRELRRRLQLQDGVTAVFLLVTFVLTLFVSACSIYQVAEDVSGATFYTDPQGRQQRLVAESNEPSAFLSAFSSTPQNCRLRIVGRHPEEMDGSNAFRNWHARSLASRGLQGTLAALVPMRPRRRRLPFDVALDLTPFITSSGLLSEDNMETLNQYINAPNPLRRLLLQKQVEWANWEDVATNIRQRLKALGFPGDVDVYLEAYDEVLVYRNHKWANFVRNRATQALVVISIVGWLFWLPYVWIRMRTTKVQARFQVNLEPSRYWDLVSDGLNAAWGFQNPWGSSPQTA